ncbi:hypothetical protein AZE42_04504 [Rhizopogon vesiculosus]|uniref:F-box domain-containing protein n=1 Tax=Rhizopogon vesiculosus TaxID=180088 RepID=A0A1J8QNN0_9AGAM|nr:hypothetical protein AZE42_04504 [Rhizopogon vesiculosus]
MRHVHVCLLPTEILLDIFTIIRDDEAFIWMRPSRDYSTIAALARTCRAFKEPALDVLWKNMDRLKPLISYLPEGVKVATNGEMSLRRPPFAEEWMIFSQYAHRIHSLTIYYAGLDEISDLVAEALAFAPSSVMLPNLRTLEWLDDRDSFFPLLRTLLVPTITSITLSARLWLPWKPSSSKSAVLASLGSRCPSIRKLHCVYGDSCEISDTVSDTVSEAVRGYHKLVHLTTGVLDAQALTHLASLPSLKSLCFLLSHRAVDDIPPANSIPMFASKLDEVSITAVSYAHLTWCFRSFGDFQTLCTQVPSYTWCNLFYRQLLTTDESVLQGLSQNTTTAPVGVNPVCGIPKVNDGSLGNIANILACGLSCFVVLSLIHFTGRRKAAVGRVELRIFFCLYLLTLPFQLITTGSFLTQGSSALVVLTAIHAGLVATLFWTLLANSIVATQVVEDGTLSSIIVRSASIVSFHSPKHTQPADGALHIAILHILSRVLRRYNLYILGRRIQLDKRNRKIKSTPIPQQHTIVRAHQYLAWSVSSPIYPIRASFLLCSLVRISAALFYFGIMLYIVLGILNEIRPVWYYVISAILFVLSQLDYFLLSKIICKASSMKVDGSFIATVLETASVVALYFAWRGITEEDWDNDAY